MGKPLDLTGRRFGKLIALNVGYPRGGKRAWRCACDCGENSNVVTCHLISGATRSCGCAQYTAIVARQGNTTHGYTPKGVIPTEYNSWICLRQRCYYKSNVSYADYGGRGITVCDRWRFGENGTAGFGCFMDDMGFKPTCKHTIDRIDVNLGYYKDNCIWATTVEQHKNKRKRARIEQFSIGELSAEINRRILSYPMGELCVLKLDVQAD